MKLESGFYASSHGIGSLILGMPTKNPKKKEKAKVGGMVHCEAREFIYPFRGHVEHLYNHSAIVCIENAMEYDKWLAKSKKSLAMAGLVDMEVISNEI